MARERNAVQACRQIQQTHNVFVRAWHYLVAAATFASFLICFGVRFLTMPRTIPPYVQFQTAFSKDRAALFYAKARRELRQNYWRGLYRDVKALQPKYARHELWNGQGSIQGILMDLHSNVVAFVKFKDGNSYWLTVQSDNALGLAKLQVSPVGGPARP
jgi:hypothetical protein